MINNKTFQPKSNSIAKKWLLVDAKGKTLGRLATTVANILRGKHKAGYAPHVDTGDYVVVINARHIQVTGRKARQKEYKRHTGYPGGFRTTSYEQMLQKHPERIISSAVKGMLPKNKLQAVYLKKLKVYAEADYKEQAQQPAELQAITGYGI